MSLDKGRAHDVALVLVLLLFYCVCQILDQNAAVGEVDLDGAIR